MGDKIYVNVIIPIPISSDITYVVPDNYINNLEVGKRVLVPFGKTKLVRNCWFAYLGSILRAE